jgi:hypothetical protein
MKTDILTVSRVFRILNQYDIKDIPNSDNTMLSSIILSNLDDAILPKILKALDVKQSNDKIKNIEIMSLFFQEVNDCVSQYIGEIEKRKKHASEVLGIWKEDETIDNNKNIYQSDYYLQCYLTLSENNISPEKLNLYESFILSEEISCNKIKESIQQMLSMIEDKAKTFCLVQKENLKHANFIAFVLDIYDAVEKMYNEFLAKDKK